MRLSTRQANARTGLSLAIALVFVAALILASPVCAFAALNDTIPGPLLTEWFDGSLDQSGDEEDVYRMYLLAGERADFTMTELSPGLCDFGVRLYPSVATDFSTPAVAGSMSTLNPETFSYVAPSDGWYYLRISIANESDPGGYTMRTIRSWPSPQAPATPIRVAGADRYTTAVEMAKLDFPGWKNLDHVIIASGEDRAAADPLAASGLTWTYGAPILLVQRDVVPSSVMLALKQISAANGGVTVHVVGGPASVPNARLNEIAARVGNVVFDRIAPHGDRYELAASISRRMTSERPGEHLETDGTSETYALIANGADPETFFDALGLAAWSAKSGYPILLVEQDDVPSATREAVEDMDSPFCLIGGGPATVSEDVRHELADVPGVWSAGRVAGPDRYHTNRAICWWAVQTSPEVLHPHNTMIAARLPDALTGGACSGLRGGPILITPTEELHPAPAGFLQTFTQTTGECFILGGTKSITSATQIEIRDALKP